jgi:hypothetical protein
LNGEIIRRRFGRGEELPRPPFHAVGDLPPGVHRATLREVRARFGMGSPRRAAVATRLDRIDRLARSTGHLARLVVFGSFVTDRPEPNDVDLFLLMEDSFGVGSLVGEARLVFDHSAADAHFGASVFWTRRLAAFGGERAAVEFWQTKRDGGLRGIVEIESESP